MLSRLAYYYVRIWIEVTPLRVQWWPSRSLDSAPKQWLAPADADRPQSDPAPVGAAPRPWADPPLDWRPVIEYALDRLPLTDLTTVDPSGYPLCVPVGLGALKGDRIAIRLGSGVPGLVSGPACLSLHCHAEVFAGQENRTFVGQLHVEAGNHTFVIERALGDWSAPGNKLQVAMAFIGKGPKLVPRLKAECSRRHQAVPKVRLNRSI